MKPEINLNLTGNTLTILEGKALELKHPEKISITGNIHSVANFVKKRYKGETPEADADLQQIDKDKALVTVNEEEMTILLEVDPQNHFGVKVKGQLELTPELKQFCINTTKQFTREELIKLIRFNKRYFASPEAHADLLLAYQKLQIKTASELNQESDTRGNKGVNFQKTVNSEHIPTEFILTIPIFKGFTNHSFRVEICLDATDASVRFWFESVELHDIIETEKKKILEEQRFGYCRRWGIKPPKLIKSTKDEYRYKCL